MYWTDWEACKIQRAHLAGSNVTDLVPEVCANEIAVDIVGGKMYWTESSWFTKVRRANLDGSNVEDIVTQDRDTAPEASGIALDVAGGKMYWADGRKIWQANLNGTGMQVLVTLTARGVPVQGAAYVNIVLDVAKGKLYWGGGSEIHQANLDGSDIQEIQTASFINSIVLDATAGRIYYSDFHSIRWFNLDGSDSGQLVTGVGAGDLAIDVDRGKMYWVGSATNLGAGILRGKFGWNRHPVTRLYRGGEGPE